MEYPKTTKNIGQPCVICGQPTNLQRALDAEREKVKEYMTNYVPLKALEDVEAQLATLQARCAHLDVLLRDEYLPKLDVVAVQRSIADRDSRIDALEREVEKLDDDKETLQAQLADRDAMILQMGEQAAVLAKENMAVKAQLRQVEGERDQWIAANTKEPINEPVTYQALAGARFVAKRAFDELVKARSELSTLRQLVEVAVQRWRAQTNAQEGISFKLAMKDLEAATLAAQDAGKEDVSHD